MTAWCNTTGNALPSGDRIVDAQFPELNKATIRLLVIPLAVYAAWLLEIFLLEGSLHLFERFDPLLLFLYTLIACILTGTVVPLFCIRTAFVSGAINMFQIGFRSFRRTVMACSLTGIICYAGVIILNPFGADRVAFADALMLFLPGAIASVMICWVLVGTHIQAYVRGGGVAVSVSIGIMVTAALFSLTTFAYFPTAFQQGPFFSSVFVGIVGAVFFFAVRDVYATSIVVGVCSVLTLADRISALYLNNESIYIWINAVLAVSVLVGIHRYLFRNYVTLEILPK
jgi:hypothetical protein